MGDAKPTGMNTALDTLAFGTDEDVERNFTLTRKERKQIPEGLTSKQLFRDVVLIAGPALAEMLLGSLVRMVDQMMVGSLGTGAISAVGLCLQPAFLLQTLLMAVNTGATAMVARARGADDLDRANRITRQAFTISLAMGVLCSVLGAALADPMVRFMAGGNENISEEIIALGIGYFRIQCWTFLLPSLTFYITAILRGTGNSKPAMWYNIAANLVNIAGNWLLINGKLGFPKLGVAGAAWATAFGQFVGFVWALWYITSGKYYVKLRFKPSELFKFDRDIVHGITTVGVPAMIEGFFMRIGLVLYTLTVTTLGDVDFATYNICLSIQSLTLMNGQAFAVSATALIGQSLGRKRLDMADHYGRYCRLAAQVLAVVLAVVFFVFPKQLLNMFLAQPDSTMSAAESAKRIVDNTRVLKVGQNVMFMLAFMQPIQCSQFVVGGILRGAGDTKVTAVILLVTTTILRPLFGWVFVTLCGWGLPGAWGGLVIDQILRTGLFFVRFGQGKWKRIRL
ncbi:MAG: MATE family efflux transporter [Oscillospiraceae bacterium]|jgi:putative MATE family efflux protein|nr:MATE family efflux transporter [Oscillospiraceae bacterium]